MIRAHQSMKMKETTQWGTTFQQTTLLAGVNRPSLKRATKTIRMQKVLLKKPKNDHKGQNQST
jgi:hypothetical protein